MPESFKRKPTESNAEVFTPPFVVDYMLDAVQTDLGHSLTFRDHVLEPSAGDGAFLLPLVDRVIATIPKGDWQNGCLGRALLAFETNPVHADSLRRSVFARLLRSGCPADRANALVSAWIHEEDFLKAEIAGPFDVVVGNPPYIRYDAIDNRDVKAYLRRFQSFRGRCDLCVPFIERSLKLLAPDGVFCFICSNRFTKSEYGARLRAMISADFHVALYLNLEHADVFGRGIAAYPAIMMVDRRRGGRTFAATASSLDATPLHSFQFPNSRRLEVFQAWYRGDDRWATTKASTLRYIRQINAKLPTLAESAFGTRFGIGVATGCDDVFVCHGSVPGVEEDCILPLVTGDDVRSGRMWGGSYLVNPFLPDASGAIRDLSTRPGLAGYFERHRERLSSRFVAQRKEWFRTIDRVNWTLFKSPKILLPDIQFGGVVGIDQAGALYPHHNLCWIVSRGWPLDLLAAILGSSFVTRQIRWASSEVRGGGIRYQAKNLQRLRLPPRSAVSPDEERRLTAAFWKGDPEAIDRIVDSVVERCLESAGPFRTEAPQQLLLAIDM